MPETPGESCENPKTTREELANLKTRIEEESETIVAEVTINGHSIISYTYLYERITNLTPRKYLDYIVSVIETPDDIFQVTNTNNHIVEWKNSEKDKNDVLLNAEITLANGGYDCDNLAWLTKVLFDKLGCKKGIDYHAKVIASGERQHAVCIYRDETGKLCSIDQVEHKKDIPNICEASSDFKDCNDLMEEYLYEKNGVTTRIRTGNINQTTLRPNYNDQSDALVYDRYNQTTFDPNKILPEDWIQYAIQQVRFQNEFTLFYTNGILDERRDNSSQTSEFFNQEGRMTKKRFNNPKDGIIAETYYEDGTIEQRNKSDGTIERYYQTTGKLEFKIYPETNNISNEYYYPDGITIKQRQYRNQETSKIQAELFDQNGHLEQIDYWDGTVDIINPETGIIRQKKYPETSEIEIIGYDTEGRIAQKDFRNGILELYDPETGKLIQRNFPEPNPIEGEKYFENGNVLKIYRAGRHKYKAELHTKEAKLIAANTWNGEEINFE